MWKPVSLSRSIRNWDPVNKLPSVMYTEWRWNHSYYL